MLARKVVEETLGKSFADTLDEVIISHGYLEFTRRQMVEHLGCPNFNAASRFNKVLKKFDIRTAVQLFNTNPLDLASTKGVGMAQLFVAMCILDYVEKDVAAWWGWKETNLVKFSTFKHRALVRAKKRSG